MLAAIAERLGSAGLGTQGAYSLDPLVDCESFCISFFEALRCITQTLNQAVSGTRRPNIIWRVQRQLWCLITLLFLVCNY